MSNKFMRHLPTYTAAVFLLVQVWGLADYSTANLGGNLWRGWMFAASLEIGIFSAWYFTRQNVTAENKADGKLTANQKKDLQARLAAGGTALLFMVASGFLNTAKSISDLPAEYTGWQWGSAFLFGICPTLFASALGFLQGNLNRLPVAPVKPNANAPQMRLYAMADKLYTLMDARIDAALQSHPETETAQDAKSTNVKLYKCDLCGAKVKNPGNHKVWDCKKNPNRRQRKATK